MTEKLVYQLRGLYYVTGLIYGLNTLEYFEIGNVFLRTLYVFASILFWLPMAIAESLQILLF